MCSLDSIFQRMGRVFRSREYLGDEPNVYVYDDKNGVPYVIDEDIYDYSLEELVKYDGVNVSEADKVNMMNEVFSKEKLQGTKYYNKIKKNIEVFENVTPYDMTSKEAREGLRNISSIKLIPDNIYDELYNSGKTDEWEEVLKNPNSTVSEKLRVKREIDENSVSVSYTYNLEYDKKELFYTGSNVYRTPYMYEFDKEKLQGRGLVKEVEEGNNQL